MKRAGKGKSVGDPVLDRVLDAVVAGDPVAEEKFYAALQTPVRTAVRRFMPLDALEADDIVQETLTVAFRYVREGGGFEGDLVRFAITVARNRCRNVASWRKRRPGVPIESMLEWVESPARSALDLLLADEARRFLQEAVDGLGRLCRILLRGFYLRGYTIERLRALTGFKTVQGVYYRRGACLKELAVAIQDSVAAYAVRDGMSSP
ncbi:sigma-70 family RNA polymerase sigma factor [bacterium]|nr:sigma-70 family RNA polymerase sigma factor [bacterium]MBU1073748.1 sigma-70 family RNA polymerase sigma factor [bacterium]MBU1677062.1 sigma-70 family RNA polymerase sigma factor [bacterium]